MEMNIYTTRFQLGSVKSTPLVILALVAALVVSIGLLVNERANNYRASLAVDIPGTAVDDQRQQYRWRLVTTWPKNFPGLGMAPEYFARLVNEMTGGQLQIQVYGGGELVPALGVFDAVSSGSVEMGHGASYYWKGKIPAAPFFTAVPFGMNAQEVNAWIMYGGGLELWRELYEPFNVVPFLGGNTGVQFAGWFNKEIKSIKDIKGLKMRIPGIAGEVFSLAGGAAVTIPGGELYTSMQTGVIDATEWVAPYNDMAFGLPEVGEFYYYPGWHEPGSALELIINKETWDSLPAPLQKIIETAARATNQNTLDEFTARNASALVNMKERFDVVPRPLPVEVIKEFHTLATGYYEKLSASDPVFARVYSSYSAFQKEVEAWHVVSEEAYYDARK
jgi:TRAP-type mannitol/chloroaromatic compound transport system substrate-binding protein